MDLKKIKETITRIEQIKKHLPTVTLVTNRGNVQFNMWADDAYDAKVYSAAVEALAPRFVDAIYAARAGMIAELEAEIRGEIAPTPVVPPYWHKANELLGEHCGLNADWNSMAWGISGDLNHGVYLLDNETNETFSIVARHQDEDIVKIITIIEALPLEEIIPIVLKMMP